MKEITRHNYEEFFLDYLEGTLSSLQGIVLEDFLTKNPDLKAELEEMECPVLSKDTILADSESLKEIPFRESFDDFCIARLEGDLLVGDESAFDAFLDKNESFKKESEVYNKTILLADTNLVFRDKNKLKRSSRKVAFWWYFSRVGVAALIILVFSLWSILYQFKGDYSNEEKITAKVETVITERKEIPEGSLPVGVLIKPEQKVVQTEAKTSLKDGQKEIIDTPVNEAKIQDLDEVVERITPLDISLSTEFVAIANSANPAMEIDIPKDKKTEVNLQNNGLAQLGMSWKSSIPEKKAQTSVLFAIAKYGVDKLSEIAGKDVQFEQKYDSKTEKTRLDFNTAGIGFSKTIK
ncbi:hypothetical protein [Labilibaculum antarcticum]|uniref:Uncharacterized protein n=1 Tax=Labilibaculum antarcticum TaxID=1717717 RepID=A0A1Y1CIB3_9BACT|nr:hypothetical protein [Labilibaculum antarcticum]BAX80138.1 hypothetical protein ALGA_1764 [Labilibaculum antarcticum]